MSVGSARSRTSCHLTHVDGAPFALRPRLAESWCGFYFAYSFFATGSTDAFHARARTAQRAN